MREMRKKSFFALVCLLQLTILAAAQGGGADKVIDTHCHYTPEFYLKLLAENNDTAGGRPILPWNVTDHLAFMDALNISFSICSVSTPGAVVRGLSIDQSRTLARQLNEYGYNLTKQYPNRFGFLATLPLPDVEGSVVEAIHALDTLKAAGVIILASTSGEVLGSPLYKRLYAELNKRNAIVFVHPGQSPCPEVEPSSDSRGLPPFVVDFLLDTTRAAVNLVYRNVTQDYPNMKFLLAHSGGFLPFATGRILGNLSILNGWARSFSLSLLQMFYVDTAISGNRWAFPSTIELLNVTHVTYGSDYPFVAVDKALENTLILEQYIQQNLGTQAHDLITFKTATELFAQTIHRS